MTGKRAARVCSTCHARKTRCDVEVTKIPCSKCSELGQKCVVRTRKPYSPRKKPNRRSDVAHSVGGGGDDDGSSTDADEPPNLELGDHSRIVAAAFAQPSMNTTAPIPVFVGDAHGMASLLDATGNVTHRHFQVLAGAGQALAPEDLQYLQVKGCFSLPGDGICRNLLKAYFDFVHPTFPLIDAPVFLGNYARGGLDRLNLLLIWSIFSVAASYIPNSALQAAGFATRKAMKEFLVRRAKLMFDLSPETDKIVLVQSALLISFWFADAEDVKQSYYWTSVAFGVAQSIGLHHDAPQNPPTWRNIWWCCMLRDVSTSSAMGRPLRINKADCSCAMPAPLESQDSYKDLMLHDAYLYTHAEALFFSKLWHTLLRITDAFRDFLSSKPRDHSISRNIEGNPDLGPDTLLSTVAYRHVELQRQAALIIIYRVSQEKEKLKQAASSATAIVQGFLADGTVVYVAPFTLQLVIPAMLTYLVATKSRKRSSKNADEILGSYMRFLEAISDNYPAAAILHKIFTAAKAVITEKNQGDTPSTDHSVLVDGSSLDFTPPSWDFDWTAVPNYEALFSDLDAAMYFGLSTANL